MNSMKSNNISTDGLTLLIEYESDSIENCYAGIDHYSTRISIYGRLENGAITGINRTLSLTCSSYNPSCPAPVLFESYTKTITIVISNVSTIAYETWNIVAIDIVTYLSSKTNAVITSSIVISTNSDILILPEKVDV